MSQSIDGGFTDLVLESQSVFRAIMDALARPGLAQPIAAAAAPPAPLPAELGAVGLTLCDHDTPVWFDPTLAASPAVAEWLRFHTGAPLTGNPAEAHFAFVADAAHLPPLDAFGQGTDEYPDRSTTIVLAATALHRQVTLTGPGVRSALTTELALPGDGFATHWADNRGRFPRGVDLLLCGKGNVVGLPRTTNIAEN